MITENFAIQTWFQSDSFNVRQESHKYILTTMAMCIPVPCLSHIQNSIVVTTLLILSKKYGTLTKWPPYEIAIRPNAKNVVFYVMYGVEPYSMN